jgi:hypothetical protein
MITADRVFAVALGACVWLMLLGLTRPGTWTRLWRALRRAQAPCQADMARHPAARFRVTQMTDDEIWARIEAHDQDCGGTR